MQVDGVLCYVVLCCVARLHVVTSTRLLGALGTIH